MKLEDARRWVQRSQREYLCICDMRTSLRGRHITASHIRHTVSSSPSGPGMSMQKLVCKGAVSSDSLLTGPRQTQLSSSLRAMRSLAPPACDLFQNVVSAYSIESNEDVYLCRLHKWKRHNNIV